MARSRLQVSRLLPGWPRVVGAPRLLLCGERVPGLSGYLFPDDPARTHQPVPRCTTSRQITGCHYTGCHYTGHSTSGGRRSGPQLPSRGYDDSRIYPHLDPRLLRSLPATSTPSCCAVGAMHACDPMFRADWCSFDGALLCPYVHTRVCHAKWGVRGSSSHHIESQEGCPNSCCRCTMTSTSLWPSFLRSLSPTPLPLCRIAWSIMSRCSTGKC